MPTLLPQLPPRLTTIGTDTGLLVLRVIIGATFIAHGAQKAFVWTISGVQTNFASLGVPAPEVAAVTVTVLELVGGAFLVLGIGTRIVGALLTISMTVALVLVHLPSGFFATDGGVELVLLLGGGAFALAVAGPGRYSIDACIPRGQRTSSSSEPGRIEPTSTHLEA